MNDIRRIVNVCVTEAADDVSPAFGQAEWLYRPSDPFAVSMKVVANPRWRFGRDLLAEGLDGPAGEGDVLVCPVVKGVAGRGVQLTLRSPDGRAVLEFDRTDVALFLRAAFKAVPRGHEHLHIDWDATVAVLLEKDESR